MIGKKNYIRYTLYVTIIFIIYISIFNICGNLNKEYNISIGDDYILNQRFPLYLSFSNFDNNTIIEFNKLGHVKKVFSWDRSVKVTTLEKGTTIFQQKILGFVPFRNIKVNVVPELRVIPGGHSIGVKLNTEGVLIVGVTEVTNEDGQAYNLAESGGIEIGDLLIAINGEKIKNANHVGNMIKNSEGKKIVLTIKRDSKIITTSLVPVKSFEDQEYRLGLWIRDKTAGVGTMSFYEPNSKMFGALGHAITDIDTGKILSIKDGELIKSRVVSIEQGKRGKPGEIKGVFYETKEPLGRLEKNTNYGVYGELQEDLKNELYDKPIIIGYQHEINEGKAYILTTLNENKIEKFEIEIVKINIQPRIGGKSMIIRIVDKDLLNKTGGIIQGMSGSPIIQNNKLVGTVTHVLINDPTRGYGIFIEWMLEESGIFDKNFKKIVEY